MPLSNAVPDHPIVDLMPRALSHAAAQVGSTTRVLVAGLNQATLLPLIQALRTAGYDVVSSRSAVRLVTQLRRADRRRDQPPEVLVLDATIQPWANAALVEGIREAQWDLPIILIVDRDDVELRAAGDRLGISACIEGPADVSAVVRAVAKHAPAIHDAMG